MELNLSTRTIFDNNKHLEDFASREEVLKYKLEKIHDQLLEMEQATLNILEIIDQYELEDN